MPKRKKTARKSYDERITDLDRRKKELTLRKELAELKAKK
jgi:hypothetical protein